MGSVFHYRVRRRACAIEEIETKLVGENDLVIFFLLSQSDQTIKHV
jgi:hypothetical protein